MIMPTMARLTVLSVFSPAVTVKVRSGVAENCRIPADSSMQIRCPASVELLILLRSGS